ncbi:conserved exported hypothetical protein [Candidatus Zixiibacteriota bacterium]|nr:conserved exported hypothetical protein [candidate division Zixibacteria bacterium]
MIKFKASKSLFFIFLTAGALGMFRNASADETFQPVYGPSLTIPRFSGAINIDGDLSEAAWGTAGVAENFSETNPGDMIKPPVETRVLVGYDEANFYFAFIAFDNPRLVRASMRDRDDIWRDDYVGIILDTYSDAAWAYEIFINPLGIQGDLKWQQNGEEDMSFDLVFHSRGKITDSGFQVEVAVPFSSLRYPGDSIQTWKATFWRNMPRESRYQLSWSAYDRGKPCWPCQFGTITGIMQTRAGKNFEILPAVTGSEAGYRTDYGNPHSSFHNDKVETDLALNGRALLASNLTADLTWNPDFSQVESDPGQIDVNNNFALFYEERRPFFQEGADLFETPIQMVYTRMFNEPDGAGKLTGQIGRTSFGYIGAIDKSSPFIIPLEEQTLVVPTEVRSTANIIRAKSGFGQDSYIGLLLADRRLDGGGSGSSFGSDMSFLFLKNYRILVQGEASYTKELNDTALSSGFNDMAFGNHAEYSAGFNGEKYWGHSIFAMLEREARLWNIDLSYWEATPTFRAENGFETRNDVKRLMCETSLNFRPNGKYIISWAPGLTLTRIWNFRNQRKDEWVQPTLTFVTKGMTTISLSYMRSRETYRGIYFPGIRSFSVNFESVPNAFLELSGYMAWGHRVARRFVPAFLGKTTDMTFDAVIKPTSRLVLAPSVEYAHMTTLDGQYEIYDGYIFRVRTNYQFTRELFLRLIVQYDDFEKSTNIEPLLSYKVNPFTIFYVGSSHNYRDFEEPKVKFAQMSRQFFMKFQYLFRV